MQPKEEELDLADLKNSLETLRHELEEEIQNDPEYDGEGQNLLDAIHRLQSELADVKSEKEFYETKFLKCLPDLSLVYQFLNEVFLDECDFDEESADGEDMFKCLGGIEMDDENMEMALDSDEDMRPSFSMWVPEDSNECKMDRCCCHPTPEHESMPIPAKSKKMHIQTSDQSCAKPKKKPKKK